MKSNIIVVILSFFISSCINKDDNGTEAFITLVFNKPKICDTLFYNNKPYTLFENQITYCESNSFIDKSLDVKKGTKTIRIKSKKSIFLRHSYFLDNYYSSDYVFYPGDTLVFDYENGVPFVKSLKNKAYNYNYKTNFNLKNKIGVSEELYIKMYNNFKSEIDLINDSILKVKIDQKQSKYFDSLTRLKKVSKIDYENNLSIFKNKFILENQKPIEILKDTLNLSILRNRALVYKAFIKYYDLNEKNISLNNSKDLFDAAILLKNINLKNRDYLMFINLENLIKLEIKKDFINSFKIFEKEVSDKSLIKYFKDKYPTLFIEKIDDKKEVFLFSKTKTKTSLRNILDINKGKVVYLDFWASWCAPCRALMPNSKKLHDEFKNEVVFVYVSIDFEFDKWLKANEKENLSKLNNSYLAINYPQGKLFQELQLKNIPRYLLFDKTGKLVNSNAPNPASKEIKAELEKYINQ